MTTPADDTDAPEDEGIPITENAMCELHIGHDIIVNGRPIRIYVKYGDNAFPGESDIEHVGRVQEILINTYLNHTAHTRAIIEKTAKDK